MKRIGAWCLLWCTWSMAFAATGVGQTGNEENVFRMGRTGMDEADRVFATKMFAERPELFPEERRPAILDGRVTLGMTPYEAKLAGGAFAFRVIADPARWPSGSDPYKVMWRQSIEPDESQIWMTFKNASQFPGQGERVFRVHFQHGKAVEIEIMEAPK